MPIGVAQAAQNVAAATGTTLSVSFVSPVAAGSVLHCFVANKDVTGEIVTVLDNVNGAWPAAIDTVDDGTHLETVKQFSFPNSAAGSIVVTATFSITTTLRAIWAVEIPGAAPISPLDGHIGQVQAAPGASTDAISSGTQTNVDQPALIIALSMDNRALSPMAPAAGTGFTSQGAGWDFAFGNQARLESKRITTTSPVAATFTGTVGVSPTTLMAMYNEVGATLLAAAPQATASLVGAIMVFSGFGAAPQADAMAAGSTGAASAVAATPQAATALSGQEIASAALALTPTASVGLAGAGNATAALSSAPSGALSLPGSSVAMAVLSVAPTALVDPLSTGDRAAVLSPAPQASTVLAGVRAAVSTFAPAPSAAMSLSAALGASCSFVGSPDASFSSSSNTAIGTTLTSSPTATCVLFAQGPFVSGSGGRVSAVESCTSATRQSPVADCTAGTRVSPIFRACIDRLEAA